VEGTTVKLKWTPPQSTEGVAIIGIVIKYGVQGSDDEEFITEMVDQNTTSHTLSRDQLKPQTSYIFAVAAVTEAGQGPFSDFSECVQTNTG